MSTNVGLLLTVEAKAGEEDEVAKLLASARPIVEDEPATIAWFAIRLGPSTFGVFDAFPDESGREAHLNGQVPAVLNDNAHLFASEPEITTVDVLADKLP